MGTDDDVMELDVLVVGAGVGGLTAAAALAEAGLVVGVVERGDQIGGSAALSEGYVWTTPDRESFVRQDPDGDTAMFEAMRAELEPAFNDMSASGVELGAVLDSVLGYGYGREVDIVSYMNEARRAVERADGWVLVQHQVSELLTDGERVTGAIIEECATGDRARVDTRAVVLATGGFQGSKELREKHLGPWGGDLLLRANPQSDGAGLALGRSVGGALTRSMDGFYGHLVPAPLDRWEPSIFTAISQYHSDHGILLDRAGHRFTDEAAGDHINTQEVARIGTALLFIDNEVWQTQALASPVPGMPALDRVRDALALGAHVSIGDDLESTVAPVEGWGFDRAQVLETLRSVQRDRSGPRGAALDRAPFALMEVQAAITFTFGGLRTDAAGRVLRDNGEPVGGLWAAGVDAAGLNVRGYAGGLVRGVTLGRVSARAIAAELAHT